MTKVRVTAHPSTRNGTGAVVKRKTKSPVAPAGKAAKKVRKGDLSPLDRLEQACRMPRGERADRRIAVVVGLLEQVAAVMDQVAADTKSPEPKRPAHAPDRVISADDLRAIGRQAAQIRMFLGVHGFGSPLARSPVTAGSVLRDLATRLDWCDHADDLDGGGPAVLRPNGKTLYTADELYPHLADL